MANNPKDEKLLDHNYDGIQELDNNLPTWWLALFWGCIIWGAGYYAYYEFGSGPSILQELNQDMNEIKVAISKNPNQNPSGPSEEKLNAALKDESQLTKGKALYAGKCASCHGQKGEGLIGPNLADKYWINGDGNISSIAKTISEGVPAKGMPPWAAIFTEPELTQIVAFVKSLKGTSPPNGKAPQGTEHE